MSNVQPVGVIGNLRSTRVIEREIGRLIYRETIPSCGFPFSINQGTPIDPVSLVFGRADRFEKAIYHEIVFQRHAELAGHASVYHSVLHYTQNEHLRDTGAPIFSITPSAINRPF